MYAELQKRDALESLVQFIDNCTGGNKHRNGDDVVAEICWRPNVRGRVQDSSLIWERFVEKLNGRRNARPLIATSSGRCSPAKKGKVSPPCPFSLKPKRLLRVMQASSLTDSLRSVVRLRRAVSAHSKAVIRLSTESGDNAGKNMWAKGQQKARNRKKAALLAFFHRLRPPDEHHKNRRSSQRWRNPTGL